MVESSSRCGLRSVDKHGARVSVANVAMEHVVGSEDEGLTSRLERTARPPKLGGYFDCRSAETLSL